VLLCRQSFVSERTTQDIIITINGGLHRPAQRCKLLADFRLLVLNFWRRLVLVDTQPHDASAPPAHASAIHSFHNLFSSALGRAASLRRFSLANLLPWIICACVCAFMCVCVHASVNICVWLHARVFNSLYMHTRVRVHITPFDTNTDTDTDRHRPQACNASQD
jgi:hypothetical protein